MQFRALYPRADILDHGTLHDIDDMWNKFSDGQLGQLSCDQDLYMTTGTEEGKHTASKSRHLVDSPHSLCMIISQATPLCNTSFSPHSRSLTSCPHLKVPRLQLFKHLIRIVRSTYLNHTLPIRLLSAKDVLARGRVMLIDVFVVQPHGFGCGDGVGDEGVDGERDAIVVGGGGPGYCYIDHCRGFGC